MAVKKTEKSFNELKAELEEVLDSLQREDGDIDEAIKSYEQGMQLIGLLEQHLKTAENKITKLKKKFES